MNKKSALAGLIGISLLATAFVVRAAEVIAPTDREDANITVGAGESHKNPYVVGGNVSVNSNTTGDLVTAGGAVTVTGNVEQDAIVLGGSLNLNGSIGGDARVAGGNITITGPISGDLALAGGNVDIGDKSSVGGDLLLGAGNLNLNAPVKGTARIAGGNITINSKVEGDVYVRAGRKLVFGPNAEVTGRVVYKGPSQAEIKQGAKVGNIEFTEVKDRGFKNGLKALVTAAFLIKLLAWILVGFLAVRFKKGFADAIFSEINSKPWESLGWGLLGLIMLAVLTFLLLISLVGYYLAGLLGLSFILMILVANVFSAVMLGYFLMKYLGNPGDRYYDYEAVIIGVVLLTLLKFIPVLGWIVVVALFLLTFGSVLKYFKAVLFNKNN